MSPLEIEMLLWFGTRAEPFPHLEARSQQAAICRFVQDGLIESRTEVPYWRLTPVGEKWKERLLAVAWYLV